MRGRRGAGGRRHERCPPGRAPHPASSPHGRTGPGRAARRARGGGRRPDHPRGGGAGWPARAGLQLGGTYHEVVGDDVATALASFATAERATQLVLGASRNSRLSELLRGSPVTSVLRRLDSIDVHVIADTGDEHIGPRPLPVVRSASALPWRRKLAGWVIAVDAAAAPDGGARPVPRRPAAVHGPGPVPRGRGARSGGRWPDGRAGGRGRRVLAGELVLHPAHPHVDDRRRRSTWWRCPRSWRCLPSSACSWDGRCGAPADAGRARAEAQALARVTTVP